jgi:hypothetical protein
MTLRSSFVSPTPDGMDLPPAAMPGVIAIAVSCLIFSVRRPMARATC